MVKEVTSCYLIDLCKLCGVNPLRGECIPKNNVSKCECFTDQNNPSISYTGDFCQIPKDNSIISRSPSWEPIVIGVLGGLAGLLCIITSFILVRYCRRKKQ